MVAIRMALDGPEFWMNSSYLKLGQKKPLRLKPATVYLRQHNNKKGDFVIQILIILLRDSPIYDEYAHSFWFELI